MLIQLVDEEKEKKEENEKQKEKEKKEEKEKKKDKFFQGDGRTDEL